MLLSHVTTIIELLDKEVEQIDKDLQALNERMGKLRKAVHVPKFPQ